MLGQDVLLWLFKDQRSMRPLLKTLSPPVLPELQKGATGLLSMRRASSLEAYSFFVFMGKLGSKGALYENEAFKL